jgi:hypothetical protein
MTTATIVADFASDVATIAADRLLQLGARAPSEKSPLNVLEQYLTVAHRLVPVRRRRSVWSDALSSRLEDFLAAEMLRISKESESGSDLNHYLSRQVPDGKYDRQLNDWDITHLHLGGPAPGSALSRSTSSKALLFVRITDGCLYLIDIADHKSFSSQALFDTVHRNWPESIAEFKVPNATSDFRPSDAMRSRLREKFVMPTVASDGTVYAPPGLGQMTSGMSVRVRIRADGIITEIYKFQKLCQDVSENILTAADNLGLTVPKRLLRLRLVTFGQALIAEDENCGVRVTFVRDANPCGVFVQKISD